MRTSSRARHSATSPASSQLVSHAWECVSCSDISSWSSLWVPLIGGANEPEEINRVRRPGRCGDGGGTRGALAGLDAVADAGVVRRFTELQPVAVQGGAGADGSH